MMTAPSPPTAYSYPFGLCCRYMQGEQDPPYPPVMFDLKRDFNAAGDGVTDDTHAFAQALNASRGGE